ncbi:hypothetical protein ACIRG5_36730 [Lentzea sp. NPDC102401]|uniref:hypothetical protein n=1 Tax=Lentzea sp. NPDC102401 TaxID=3364128 RepID=UPI00380D4082
MTAWLGATMPGSVGDDQSETGGSARRGEQPLFSRLFKFRTSNPSHNDQHDGHLTPGYYTHTSYWPVTTEDHEIPLDELYDGLNSMTSKQYEAAMASLAAPPATPAPSGPRLADQHKLDT